MTRADLIQATAKAINVSTKDAQTVVVTFFKTLEAALARGETVELRGLGTFGIKVRKASVGRNVRTGEVIPVSSHAKVFFRLGRELKKNASKIVQPF